MNLGLESHVVVVVGAASGIGRAIAREFTAEGALVCWLDRQASVTTVADESTDNAAHPPLSYQVDATDYAWMTETASDIAKKRGRCDHVVVAIGAGSGKFGFPFWNLDPSDWQDVLHVNLIGTVNVCHAFVPHMLPARRGTICFLSSVAGQIGSPSDPPYSAAKAALINFAQCAAQDLASYNIRVNAVSPGMVKTPLNRSVWQAWRAVSDTNTLTYDEWADTKIKKISPLARWQQPEDIAAMVTFLASDRAQNITGQTLNVDGGQVMHS